MLVFIVRGVIVRRFPLVMNSWFFLFSLVVVGLSVLVGVLFLPVLLIVVYYYYARRFEKTLKN